MKIMTSISKVCEIIKYLKLLWQENNQLVRHALFQSIFYFFSLILEVHKWESFKKHTANYWC